MRVQIDTYRVAPELAATGPVGDSRVSEAERVRTFWRGVERYGVGANIGWEGGPNGKRVIIVSGWACELRILPDGRRQIFSFLLPGDLIEVAAMSNVGTRGVIALTRLEVVNTAPLLANDGATRDSVLKALKTAGMQKEDRLYDHMVRMGRLSARERVVHLLLELCERLEGVRLVKGDTFRLPLTQEVFADALGLSVVHINRTLQQLRRDGVVRLKSGSVTLYNRAKLAALSCYQSQRTVSSGEISPMDSINLMIQPVSVQARHSAA